MTERSEPSGVTEVASDDLFNGGICCHHKLLPDACQRPAKWQSCNTGNWTDRLIWCDVHVTAFDARYFKPLNASLEARASTTNNG